MSADEKPQESFVWEPYKGRIRYCDDIAIDLICKMNQGIYPVGTLLPDTQCLADIYHVSPITMRRTIRLLKQLGTVISNNGVGIRVMQTEGSGILHKLKDLTLDENLKTFLEAIQLLELTCEPVFRYTYPYFTREAREAIFRALSITDEKKSMVSTISAGMQAITRCCPLGAIREIYSKITLLLLKGSVLRLNETGQEPVVGWPEISTALRDSHIREDGEDFARAFRRLIANSFDSSRQTLLELGIKGIDSLRCVHS